MRKKSLASVYIHEGTGNNLSTSKAQDVLPAVILLLTADQAIGERMVYAITEKTPHLVIWTKKMRETLDFVENILPHILLLDEPWFSMCEGRWYRRLRASRGMKQVSIIALSDFLHAEQSQGVDRNPFSPKESITQEHLLETLNALL